MTEFIFKALSILRVILKKRYGLHKETVEAQTKTLNITLLQFLSRFLPRSNVFTVTKIYLLRQKKENCIRRNII